MSHRTVLFLYLLVPAFVLGCLGCSTQYTTTPLHQTPDLMIGIASPSTPEEAPHFEHPYRFVPGELDQLLGTLRYKLPTFLSWSDPTPVFDSETREQLTPYLERAFARAEERDKVVFQVTTRLRASLGSSKGPTRGHLYVADNRLHIVLLDLAGHSTNPSGTATDSSRPSPHWRLTPQEGQERFGTRLNTVSLPLRRRHRNERPSEDPRLLEERKLFEEMGK